MMRAAVVTNIINLCKMTDDRPVSISVPTSWDFIQQLNELKQQ